MNAYAWRALYRKAILECDAGALRQELPDAENAIVARAHELYQSTGAEAEVEKDALDDAMYALHALKDARAHTFRAA